MATMTTKLPDHLFISSTDGGLYDTRKPDWSKSPALRPNYKQGHREINSVADLKASLRNGPYVWPGGYELVYLTSDGALLCSQCTRRHFRSIADSIKNKANDGWRVVACGYEATPAPENHMEQENDNTSYCDQCATVFGEIC